MKENLALVLEMLSLYMGSLQQYDELSSLFLELKHIKTPMFFSYFASKFD